MRLTAFPVSTLLEGIGRTVDIGFGKMIAEQLQTDRQAITDGAGQRQGRVPCDVKAASVCLHL